MTSNPDRYYRSAGAVPFAGILLVSLFGFVAAAVCGGLYAAADWYIAYDIIPFLFAPLSGAAIGGAIYGGALLGRVRHRGFLALVGLAMGLIGAYFSWVVFIRIWDGGGFWLWDPLGLLLAINEISEIGIWENQPTGIWLKLIYGVEALTITVASAIVASLPSRPFCDPCNQWTKQLPETAILKLTDPEALRERLEDSQYEALDELFDPTVDAANCFHANVLTCPGCEESNYLTVSHFTIVQKGGETNQNEERFVTCLWVPPEVVEQVKRLASAWEQARGQQVEFAAAEEAAADNEQLAVGGEENSDTV